MEKEVEISTGKVVVKELKFIETFKPETTEKIKSNGYVPTMLQLATGLSDDEINNLSKKDGQKLWGVYQELNEDDFQKPQDDETDSKQP